MDDLEKYIAKRKKKSPTFVRSFELGYENFRIGYVVRQAREELGITQEEIANSLSSTMIPPCCDMKTSGE